MEIEYTYGCLYFGDPEECINCGGWMKAEGGPFQGVDGIWTCSEECWEESKERVARHQEAMRKRYACCTECGFDNQEHAPCCVHNLEAVTI